jgi:hypothetical protein
MYYWIGKKLYQLSTSSPYTNVIHIHMKMTASYIYITKYTYIHLINRSSGEKKGIECKCMISYWIQSIISYHPNLLAWCIYFCTFPNTIKLFSSVKLSEPNNKFEIGVYGVMFISSKGYFPSSSQCFVTNMVNYI